ncbi:DUF1845 family protein [Gallibacterium anatis]|uniref:DUF1845 family protein n=1 Tax=Gallibacterium anatis TaxID=750 RepID=A0A930Y8V5_9PAST|nr:DUF1845 family protein [Gallibacterium anatis]
MMSVFTQYGGLSYDRSFFYRVARTDITLTLHTHHATRLWQGKQSKTRG